MKSKILAIVLVLGVALFTTSCNKDKCMTCTYDFGGQSVSSGESCGSDSELDDVQASFESAAIAVGLTADDVTCTRD